MVEQELIERILIETARGENESEIRKARDDYFEQMKDLREDDTSYERLISCFQNWYVFDRPMDNGRGTPLQVFATTAELTSKEHSLLCAMAANIHSLFEVLRIEENGPTLRDLFTTEVLRVSERRTLAGLEKGDILEARLLPVGEKLVFSAAAFGFHPREAGALIRQAVEHSRMEGTVSAQGLMNKLRALTFRYTDRFRHRVPVEKVYGEIVELIGADPSKSASSP
jgi:hypothetical protein